MKYQNRAPVQIASGDLSDPVLAGHTRRALLLGATALGVFGCSRSKIRNIYRGPVADGVIVQKADRRLYVMRGETVLAAYEIDLGFAPFGHKGQRGDGRTPEGAYVIDRRNYNSEFFLSLGISYPNEDDIARAKEAGLNPGGDIFIHGGPRKWSQRGRPDWTAGCISVTDKQMEQIYQMVPDGTPIWINP